MLSAFACSPLFGSECEVGWRWALELSLRYDVVVVTLPQFRVAIESALAIRPMAGIRFEYFAIPGLGRGTWQLNSRLYYWVWQLLMRWQVKRLLEGVRIDLIHHLTWGTYRFPSFLGGLGVPLAWGPLGGGERAPRRFYTTWPWREKLYYGLRDLSIRASRWDPFVQWCCRRTDVILVKTEQTRAALPCGQQAKAVLAAEIGAGPVSEPLARPRLDGAITLLYAGRMLGGKGLPYVLRMMRRLHEQQVDAHLVVAGDGRLSEWARERVQRWDLHDRVRFLGSVPRAELLAMYGRVDMLMCPSWHDSSGNVVIEALARGLPVMCLDIGGPRMSVDRDCALIVDTTGLDEHGICRAMAAELRALLNDRQRLSAMSAAALRRAEQLSWRARVGQAYGHIERALGWPTSTRLPLRAPTARVA